MALLAECFEELGGVPQVVLADRMGCLKGGVVANVVVPTADYVRFATHFGFRPDFCEAADPESKGVVEALCRYAQSDLVVPAGGWADKGAANAAARAWCAEVNGQRHSEIAAVPNDRLIEERKVLRPLPSLRSPLRRGEARKVDKLATVRFGSARYSVPKELVGRTVEVLTAEDGIDIHHGGELVATHPLVAPGECSIIDEHYGGPRRSPARGVRPRSGAERAFLALGPAAEAFLRAAAACRHHQARHRDRPHHWPGGGVEPRALGGGGGAGGAVPPLPGRGRALHPRGRAGGGQRRRRRRGPGPRPTRRSRPVVGGLPLRRKRVSAPASPLAADLVAGLKRLKLAKVRAMAPEVLQAAKVQRWSPEELLRTLVEAEIAARDESNARARLRQAGFPVTKTLAEFNVGLSSVPQASWDYLASLEWIRATENLCLVGPPGRG